jgi:hypothetical protein
MRADWHRQHREPPRAHALFERYLALGPGRSLRALAQGGAGSYSYLKKLSSLWRWHDRAASWQVRLQQTGAVDAVALAGEARERQLKDALALQQLARAQLSRWIGRDREGTLRLLRRLSPHQVARFWATGYRLESLLLPVPSPEAPVAADRKLREARYAQEEGTQPVEHLVLLDELAALVALLRKAGLSRGQLTQRYAQLLRWLWLPEEESVSLEAVVKANQRRRKTHGQRARQTKAHAPSRA